jgi:hypothetical protein
MVAPINPLLLELPLHLAVLGFAAALMGLTGSHIHQMASVKDKIANQSSFPGFVNLETTNMLQVDLAMLIIGCVQFAFSGFALLMCCEQFKKRRGEYSGKGSGAWLVVGLGQFVLLGAWTGVVAAYTAYAVMKQYSFTEGPSYVEPFDQLHAVYLRQIAKYIQSQTSGSLKIGEPNGATNFGFSLGQWDITTLAQANAVVHETRYLDNFTWKAATAVGWFELGTTFLVTVVHFALPFVWRYFGLVRQPREKGASKYNDLM